MTKTPSQTSDSISQLRSSAFAALVALHEADPVAVLELAGMLEQMAAVHTAAMPYAVCEACAIKRQVVALLRTVAALRDVITPELRPTPRA